MKPELLVLAAGMGSRFGGLKQMEPIGPSGEWLLDYSVHDALAAGFGKVAFVIREEMADAFCPLIESKYGARIEIAYAYQKLDDIPASIPDLSHRLKPWGTGHAVYAARDVLEAPFAVINADDFYGAGAFQALAGFLERAPDSGHKPIDCSLVGYELANTLSEHGSVSRGVCRVGAENALLSIEEHTEIAADPSGAISGRDARGERVPLSPATLVSLNCWGFPKGFAHAIKPLLEGFLQRQGHEPKSEFYLPAAVDSLVSAGAARVIALPCRSRWLGVTHRADLEATRHAISELVALGAYAPSLWS